MRKAIAEKLLRWYGLHHRQLPWRIGPHDHNRKADPYHVWLSEIMLQQTTVASVKPYFEKFIHQWPNVRSLADASLEDVLVAWAGLGYYSRARNLKACADYVADQLNNRFPDQVTALKQLPGIGDYTAAAIAAIAFDRSEPVIDGNVIRIVTRLFAISIPKEKAKAVILEKTRQITPLEKAGDFAQAMMDLGATVCTPKKPKCSICPLHSDCQAHKDDNPEQYPIKTAAKERPIHYGKAFVALSDDHMIYLEKRGNKGLLAGMTQIPNVFGTNKDEVIEPPFKADWHHKGDVTHIFTHFTLMLSVYRADHVAKTAAGNGWWSDHRQLDKEALPTLFSKAIQCAFNKKI